MANKYMVDIYLNPDQDVLYSHLPELNKVKHFDQSNILSLEYLCNKSGPEVLMEEKGTLLSYIHMLKDDNFQLAESHLNDILENNPKFMPAINAQCLLLYFFSFKKSKIIKILL